MKIQCFLLSPLPIFQVNLRRYTRLSMKCPATGNKTPHDAMTQVEDKEIVLGEDISARYDHSDPRWPEICKCGYGFMPDDVWQVFVQNYYEQVDPPAQTMRTTLRDAPVGAMWDAQWYKGLHEYGHKDGRILMVRTPGGDWCIDGPSETEERWKREGDPPNITVEGSIRIGDYHGVLKSGFLEEI